MPAVDSTPSNGSRRTARLAGSAFAGVVELFGFHPVDTVAKRLMNNPTRVKNIDAFSRVVLRDAHVNPSILARYTSLFPGLSFAAGYKILQRVYKFGGHPWVREQLTGLMGKDVVGRFGESKGKIVLHAMAGSIIGVGEVALLPLDVLKIKSQNNPAALKGRGLVGILRTEKLSGLYKGAGWTAARNAPGSFALFGGSALAKEKLFGLKNYNDATFGQNFIASAVGGIASITVASPLDVVKTRLQTRDFANKDSGWKILKDLFKSEGPGALFKGLVPKILVVGPKLVFSFTIAQHTIALFEQWLAPGQPEVNTRALKNKSAA